jgi:hypothetical protein
VGLVWERLNVVDVDVETWMGEGEFDKLEQARGDVVAGSE